LWALDGRHIYFTFTAANTETTFLLSTLAIGATAPTAFEQPGPFVHFEDVTRDGRYLVFKSMKTPPEVWIQRVGSAERRALVQGQFGALWPRVSPDGHWLAYNSNESGESEVYVVPFPGPGGKVRISTVRGDNARWRRDGKEIFYLAGNTLMAAAVTANRSRFDVGPVQRLFEVPMVDGYWPYDVSPDGQRFLVNTLESAVPPLTIVVNWPATLKR